MDCDNKKACAFTGWPAALAATVLVFGIYLFAATRTTLWDRDEGWHCRAAVEMVETGNYLIPTYQGKPFFDKPPLMCWCMAAGMRLLGQTELGCRLYSVVGMTLACLLTWYIGRRLFDGRVGMLAMLMLATALLTLIEGQLAVADPLMLPLVLGAMASFVASLKVGVRPLHILVLGLCMGGAMLAKGPIGLTPLAMIVPAVLLGRRSLTLGWQYIGWCCVATLIGLGMLTTWALAADVASGGKYLSEGIGVHVLGRATAPMQGHGGSGAWKYLAYLPYYVPAVVIGFFPWITHLLGAASAMLGGRLGGRGGRAVLLGMIVPVFVVMSLAATKLPHYVLPIWPGLALAVAAATVAWRDGTLTDRDRAWMRGGVWFLGPMGAIGGLMFLVFPWFVPVEGLRLGGAVAGVVLLAVTGAAVWAHLRRGPAASAAVLAPGMLALIAVIGLLVIPAVETVKTIPTLAAAVRAAVPPDAPVARLGFDEKTLTFYIDRPDAKIDGKGRDGVAAWLAQGGPGALVTTPAERKKLEDAGVGIPDSAVIAQVHLFNFGHPEWVDVLAIRRDACARPATQPATAP